jgi:hypothetical protein
MPKFEDDDDYRKPGVVVFLLVSIAMSAAVIAGLMVRALTHYL